MKPIIQLLLPSYRERRRVVNAALWLLRHVHDAEQGDMFRYSDRLDLLDFGSDKKEYMAVEEACINSEHACSFLDSAITDLEDVY